MRRKKVREQGLRTASALCVLSVLVSGCDTTPHPNMNDEANVVLVEEVIGW